jgi:ParB family chromosome partitioning protein
VAAAVLDAAQSALVTSSLETQVNAVAAEVPSRDRHMGISLVALDSIVANDYQPRRDFDASALEELAQSIRTNGVIQPLVVRKTPSGYMLIAGERRLRASKIAGLKQVPVVIRKTTDREALELALVENIQRQDLNCIDEALAYFQLIQDFSLTQEEVAERVGKDRATVANHLRLLRLPEAIIDDLKRQILSFGHGKALLVVDDNDIRLRARQQIVEKKLSVRETEALMDSLKKGESFEAAAQKLEAKGKPQNPIQARLSQLAHGLTRQFSTRVEVKGSEKRGKIVLHYSTRADLDRLLTSLQEKN